MFVRRLEYPIIRVWLSVVRGLQEPACSQPETQVETDPMANRGMVDRRGAVASAWSRLRLTILGNAEKSKSPKWFVYFLQGVQPAVALLTVCRLTSCTLLGGHSSCGVGVGAYHLTRELGLS